MSDILRLLDPSAIDARKGPRGAIAIVVPRAWLRDGARVEIDVPTRLKCAICDGGGCDACGRSGGYVRPEVGPRVLAITLPKTVEDVVSVRVTNPFLDATPTLLIVRVAGAVEPSDGARYLGPSHDQPIALAGFAVPGTERMPAIAPWLRTLTVAVVVVVLAVTLRACAHA